MKRVIIIGSRSAGEKNDVANLVQQLSDRLEDNIQLTNLYFEDLMFSISNSERRVEDIPSGRDVADADLVIAMNWYNQSLRDIAYTLALYLDEKKIPFWNSEMLAQRSTTKLSATWQLAVNDVAVPDTYFSFNRGALEVVPLDQVVVKDIAGSRGRKNYLANTKSELHNILSDDLNVRFMVQSFIPNDYDLRIVCFAGKPFLVVKRQRQSNETHLNNTSQGAKATLLEPSDLPNELIEEVSKITTLLKRELAGIDYVVANDGSNRYICLEVNAIPQLTSGSFIDKKYESLSRALLAELGKD